MVLTIVYIEINEICDTMAGILERGITIDGTGSKNFLTYESNILFALRFMIDCNIVGGNWIEISAGKYKKAIKSMSYCQLELDCLYPIGHKKEFDQRIIFIGYLLSLILL